MITDFDTATWTDPWVQGLPPKSKLLFVYLWTSNHKNLAGLYEISPSTISLDTGLTAKEVVDLMVTLEPKVLYDRVGMVVFVRNHVKRQFLRTGKISEKILANINRCLLVLPKGHYLIGEFMREYDDCMDVEYPFDTATEEATVEADEEARKPKKKPTPLYKKDVFFMEFWKLYPRQDSGPSAAYKKWPVNEIAEDEQLYHTIMDFVVECMKSEQWADKSKVPHATTFLGQRRWEGEPPPAPKGSGNKMVTADKGKYDEYQETVAQ